MRHHRSSGTYAYAWIVMLGLAVACNDKAKHPSTKLHNAGLASHGAALPDEEQRTDVVKLSFVWPRCAEPFEETNITNLQSSAHVWRQDAEIIKNNVMNNMVTSGLTQERAVRLALINNPELFAFYENIAVAHADLLEAGLRENPVFKSDVKYSEDVRDGTTWEYETTSNFLEHFLIPFREQAAIAELRVTESAIAQKVIDLVKDVELAWLAVKSLEQTLITEYDRVEIKELAAHLSSLQRNAGNINELNEQKRVLSFHEAQGTRGRARARARKNESPPRAFWRRSMLAYRRRYRMARLD